MKMWKIVILAAGILILAGCGNKPAQSPADVSSNAPETAAEKKGPSGIISSIKDAMNLGRAMECTYTVKDGMGPGNDLVSKSFVQGEKYRAENEMNGKKTISLFDGTNIYSWTEGEKKGTKMEKGCLDDISKSSEKEEKTGAEAPLNSSVTDEEAFKNAMDIKCEDTGNVDFSVPSDIVFTDQCEIMKNMLEKFSVPTENIPANLLENLPGN